MGKGSQQRPQDVGNFGTTLHEACPCALIRKRMLTETKIKRDLTFREELELDCTRQHFHGSVSSHSKQTPSLLPQSYLNPFSRWSYGANRVQIDIDTKILSDFLLLLRTDTVRGSHEMTLSAKPVTTSSEGMDADNVHAIQ